MSAPMTEQEIAEAVDAALRTRLREWLHVPDVSLNDAVGDGLHNVTQLIFDRWQPACGEGDCECGRPAWDAALSTLYNERIGPLHAEFDALIRQRFAEFVRDFLAEYPDAPRPKVEVAA